MSSSLERLVAMLDDTNYRRWAQDMKAYLQKEELWEIISQDYPILTRPSPTTRIQGTGDAATVVEVPPPAPVMQEYREEMRKWRRKNNAVQGALTLRIHPNLRHHCNDYARQTWNNLQTAYGGQSMPT